MGVKRKQRTKKEEDESSEEEGYAAVDEGPDSGAESEDEGQKEEKDGFADAMARILGQHVSKSVPVLAKRNTMQMKDIERRKKEKGELKEKRLKRLADRDRQLIKPTVLQQDKERQLRRIATRGVVALFNAIASAKKEVAEAQADEDNKARAEKAAMSGQEIKRMTQANFLDMLKGDKENGKEEEARAERAARALGLVEGDKGDGDSPGDPGTTGEALVVKAQGVRLQVGRRCKRTTSFVRRLHSRIGTKDWTATTARAVTTFLPIPLRKMRTIAKVPNARARTVVVSITVKTRPK